LVKNKPLKKGGEEMVNKKIIELKNSGVPVFEIIEKTGASRAHIYNVLKRPEEYINRPFFSKKRIYNRLASSVFPIWKYTNVNWLYSFIAQEAHYIGLEHKTNPEELKDYILDWLYSRDDKFLKHIKTANKPVNYIAGVISRELTRKARKIKKRKEMLNH
jgi:hypothetical protein